MTTTLPQPLEISARSDAAAPGPQELAELNIDCLDPDRDQPRGADPGADLPGLAASIQHDGLLAPIRVRPGEIPGRFTITSGHRRAEAKKLAGERTILCLIDRRPPDPLRILKEQIAENLHRSDIKPCHFARALERLQALSGYTLEQTAAAIHRHAAFVSRKLSLLKHPQHVQDAIDGGRLDESTAVEIAKIRNEQQREAVAERAVRDGLTRDQVAQLVASLGRKRRAGKPAARPLKRVLLGLPGAATVAVTCPDGVPELTTEIIRDSLEFALHELRKTLRRRLPADGLAAHFQKLCANARQGHGQPPVPADGPSGAVAPVAAVAVAL